MEVCRQLKACAETRDIPVIMLTARDDEIDRVVGFELGAADYVVKPFSVRELILRIDVILRRLQAPPPTEVITIGNLGINLDAHRVEVSGREVSLTRSEFDILRTLVTNRGHVYSRDDLLDAVWGRDCEVLDRTVDAHIMRLRKKLGSAARHVETVRGVGYRAV